MKTLLLILLAFPLLALDNSVTIKDAATATHTGRPVLIHRWFARGEIANYAKPRVGGNALASWQCDVKSRWDDGSVRVAYVAWRQDISSGGSVTADFVNDTNRSSAGSDSATNAAAMGQTAMLAASWNGIIETTLNSITYTANARTMVTAGAWSYWLRGPVVTWVVAEDKSTSLSYDFGYQYATGAWGAPSADQYKSFHPIFTLQFWPAVGTFSAWAGVEVDSILYNASTSRMQRIPLDKLRVLTGAAGTTESYCAGTGCSVTSAGTPNMIARRSWHTVQWSGTAPADVVVDFNFAYMGHSKVILPYDTSIQFAQSMTDGYITSYTGMTDKPEWCSDTGGCYVWLKYVPNSGARGDIAPIPAWYAYYLYGMGSDWTTARKLDLWNKVLLGSADAATSYPVHYFETATRTGTRAYFDDAGTIPAFGHITSVNSRKQLGLRNHEKTSDSYGSALDTIDPVCTSAPCDGTVTEGNASYSMSWTPELPHQGSMFFLPALLTGRPFYIWEQYFLSNWAVMGQDVARGSGAATSHTSCTSTGWYGHWDALGLRGPNSGAVREMGWATREVLLGALIAPEADPEQAYFAQRLRVNDAMWEGYFDVADGLNPPADAACPGFAWNTSLDAWCVGRKTFGIDGANPMRIIFAGSTQVGNPNGDFSSTACSGNSVWQQNFVASTFSWAVRSGVVLTGGQPVFTRTRKEASLFQLKKMLDSDAYPYSLTHYIHPATKITAGVVSWLQNHSEIASKSDFTGLVAADFNSSTLSFTMTGQMRPWTGVFNWTYSVPIGILKVGSEQIFTCKEDNWPFNTTVNVTVCPGGRGALGTVAAAHTAGEALTLQHVWWDNDHTGGYPIFLWRNLAHQTDIEYLGYSGRKAYERIAGALTIINGVTDTSHGSPMWAFLPPQDPSNVRVTGLTGSARLTYNAPGLGACKYTIASSLASSSDASDTSDGGGIVARTVTVGSLSAGTYQYRISCGNGRAIGSVVVQ